MIFVDKNNSYKKTKRPAMKLPRFIENLIPGFKIIDVKEWLQHKKIEVYLEKDTSDCFCNRCGTQLEASRGRHRLQVRHLPIFNFQVYLMVWRHKGHCPTCKKARSEHLNFIAEETPHLSREYAWWLGRMCEISAVSRVAEFAGHDKSTMHRLDFNRLRRLIQHYKIPKLKRISVDEVYSRSNSHYRGENRNQRFFTVISDLDSRRVIWVSDSRDRAALDEFYKIIGTDACREIEVVAADQHDGYRASTEEYCPQATYVWDKFHLLQSFEDSVNEERKKLHSDASKKSDIAHLACGTYRYIFLKRESDRTKEESRHILKVIKENERFAGLELVKERMLYFFQEKTAEDAWKIFEELEKWIVDMGFNFLEKWAKNFKDNWRTIKNYFKCRVTSALSEGNNNVIKTLKRRAYGYRNMTYFKLKILQVCGYLNSRYIKLEE